MTNYNLTEKEYQMLGTFVQEGFDCIGASSVEDMLADNMTYMSATDLAGTLGWDKQTVGGVMSALSDKGLIADMDESPRGAKDTDWVATDEGIRIGWHLIRS